MKGAMMMLVTRMAISVAVQMREARSDEMMYRAPRTSASVIASAKETPPRCAPQDTGGGSDRKGKERGWRW